MPSEHPLDVILRQITEAKTDLLAHPPEGVDWEDRATRNARTMVPWLQTNARDLARHVESVLNSPTKARRAWSDIKAALDVPLHLAEELDRYLELETIALSYVTGDLVSMIVGKYLVDNYPNGTLESNGRSDYPDLFDRAHDYSMLPRARRRADTFDAALKGKKNRPVRVPDGLEVKTCRGAIRVDCHHPHVGLHLVVVHQNGDDGIVVSDVCVAYLRKADYREASRQTSATTVKYSFGASGFVSILNVDEKVE